MTSHPNASSAASNGERSTERSTHRSSGSACSWSCTYPRSRGSRVSGVVSDGEGTVRTGLGGGGRHGGLLDEFGGLWGTLPIKAGTAATA